MSEYTTRQGVLQSPLFVASEAVTISNVVAASSPIKGDTIKTNGPSFIESLEFAYGVQGIDTVFIYEDKREIVNYFPYKTLNLFYVPKYNEEINPIQELYLYKGRIVSPDKIGFAYGSKIIDMNLTSMTDESFCYPVRYDFGVFKEKETTYPANMFFKNTKSLLEVRTFSELDPTITFRDIDKTLSFNDISNDNYMVLNVYRNVIYDALLFKENPKMMYWKRRSHFFNEPSVKVDIKPFFRCIELSGQSGINLMDISFARFPKKRRRLT